MRISVNPQRSKPSNDGKLMRISVNPQRSKPSNGGKLMVNLSKSSNK
jgi:hypothetical protein